MPSSAELIASPRVPPGNICAASTIEASAKNEQRAGLYARLAAVRHCPKSSRPTNASPLGAGTMRAETTARKRGKANANRGRIHGEQPRATLGFLQSRLALVEADSVH